MNMEFCSSAPHGPTQTNSCTGGQIRTKDAPANFVGSRFIGLGAVGGAIFWLSL
jgi:hypothetical protein